MPRNEVARNLGHNIAGCMLLTDNQCQLQPGRLILSSGILLVALASERFNLPTSLLQPAVYDPPTGVQQQSHLDALSSC